MDAGVVKENAEEVLRDELYRLYPSGAVVLAGGLTEWLDRLLSRDFSGRLFTSKSLIQAVALGELQAWVYLRDESVNTIFLTKLQVYPRAKVMSIPFVIGKPGREAVEEVSQVMESEARRQGCTYIQASGRRGWRRFVKRDWISLADDFYEV